MSSGFTIADVERIAALAHLELTAEEKQLFTHQLADILEYVRQCHWLIFSIRAPAPFATPWLPFAPHTDSDARGGPGLRGHSRRVYQLGGREVRRTFQSSNSGAAVGVSG
jgi:hypothetical protein